MTRPALGGGLPWPDGAGSVMGKVTRSAPLSLTSGVYTLAATNIWDGSTFEDPDRYKLRTVAGLTGGPYLTIERPGLYTAQWSASYDTSNTVGIRGVIGGFRNGANPGSSPTFQPAPVMAHVLGYVHNFYGRVDVPQQLIVAAVDQLPLVFRFQALQYTGSTLDLTSAFIELHSVLDF